MIEDIPLQRPRTPLLDRIDTPADLRLLDEAQLPQLAEELRAFLLYSVGQTGGHFGAGLGVVELTIALHYVYQTPDDKLVWDVGHQTYPHKILTGRRERMPTMRQANGLSGFPKRSESPYDTFGVGHSSTSISAAMGMAIAAEKTGTGNRSVAIIGDGAMTAGMAFEALNHAPHERTNMLVVLNDNQMSISRNTGGLNTYFSRIWASRSYNHFREGGKKVLSKIPPAWDFAKQVEEHMKGLVAPGMLFEELGWNYIGPIDGHDLPTLIHTIANLRDLDGPQLLHIVTRKGKGFGPAERDPVGYHAITKIEPKQQQPEIKPPVKKGPKYQDVFGQWLCDMAAVEPRLNAITPAMCEGSGMLSYSKQYSDRFYDVAIAEQHALTLAAGMACDGLKPVVAIYSTFLQRAYDQLIHDIALQNLDVTFGIDRAGLVGEDGPTHAGAFDLSYLRCIPNMLVMTPSDEAETRALLSTAFKHKGPAAVRYPRGTGPGTEIPEHLNPLPMGKGQSLRQGRDIAILNFGTLLGSARMAADTLNASLADMRFVKPLDEALIEEMADAHSVIVTVEENSIQGGAGSAVSEFLNARGIQTPVLQLGLPDAYIEHAKHQQMLAECGLDSDGIISAVRAYMAKLED